MKLVNATGSPTTVNVNLKGVKLKTDKATVSTLSGERDYKNGQGQHLDTDVKPVVRQEKLSKKFARELPPYSLTVIRF